MRLKVWRRAGTRTLTPKHEFSLPYGAIIVLGWRDGFE